MKYSQGGGCSLLRMRGLETGVGGEPVGINYSFVGSRLGPLVVASTAEGVCSLEFVEDERVAVEILRRRFPFARFYQCQDSFQLQALEVISSGEGLAGGLKLHVKGTDFQFKVWRELMNIPRGELVTYGEIARRVGVPRGFQAVGSAVGANPVAILIPCHRVVPASGGHGNYRWGVSLKKRLIDEESVG